MMSLRWRIMGSNVVVIVLTVLLRCWCGLLRDTDQLGHIRRRDRQ